MNSRTGSAVLLSSAARPSRILIARFRRRWRTSWSKRVRIILLSSCPYRLQFSSRRASPAFSSSSVLAARILLRIVSRVRRISTRFASSWRITSITVAMSAATVRCSFTASTKICMAGSIAFSRSISVFARCFRRGPLRNVFVRWRSMNSRFHALRHPRQWGSSWLESR